MAKVFLICLALLNKHTIVSLCMLCAVSAVIDYCDYDNYRKYKYIYKADSFIGHVLTVVFPVLVYNYSPYFMLFSASVSLLFYSLKLKEN